MYIIWIVYSEKPSKHLYVRFGHKNWLQFFDVGLCRNNRATNKDN